jgi:hypothetical protein
VVPGAKYVALTYVSQGIADNLVLFMRQFVQQFPTLAKVPFYVFWYVAMLQSVADKIHA